MMPRWEKETGLRYRHRLRRSLGLDDGALLVRQRYRPRTRLCANSSRNQLGDIVSAEPTEKMGVLVRRLIAMVKPFSCFAPGRSSCPLS